MTAVLGPAASRRPGPPAPRGFDDGGPTLALPVVTAEVVVLGSGVAGLSVALDLPACTVVTAGAIGDDGSSPLAQGGIAAAVGGDDSPAAHADDTLAVSVGIGEPTLAAIVAGGGSEAIAILGERGARFDRNDDGALSLGREAGHTKRRIVHAGGDATGAEVMRALRAAIAARPSIDVWAQCEAIDLVRRQDRVVGVVVRRADGSDAVLLANAVVVATGGYGHCFARTTTPPAVTGAGIAIAARAGAAVADMEMVQFHPTALDVAGAERLPLLTEALRGEGAMLVDERGRRFMTELHPDAELAPRDVVARAIYRQLADGHRPRLDASTAIGRRFPERFPTVDRLARHHGFDPRTEPLPVTPAAHYCMGGIAVDDRGRTSLPGLWAVGEAASSGLHGANRLASNSLLEGLVMGRRVAADITSSMAASPSETDRGAVELPVDLSLNATPPTHRATVSTAREAVRSVLWRAAGVERTGAGLAHGLAELTSLRTQAIADHDHGAVLRVTVAELVVTAALARTESRGAHHRLDHPGRDPRQAHRSFQTPPAVPSDHYLLRQHRVAGRWAALQR